MFGLVRCSSPPDKGLHQHFCRAAVAILGTGPDGCGRVSKDLFGEHPGEIVDHFNGPVIGTGKPCKRLVPFAQPHGLRPGMQCSNAVIGRFPVQLADESSSSSLTYAAARSASPRRVLMVCSFTWRRSSIVKSRTPSMAPAPSSTSRGWAISTMMRGRG